MKGHAVYEAAVVAAVLTIGAAAAEPVQADGSAIAPDSGWTNPFPSLDGYVMALATYGDTLYVGGFFATAGVETVNHIAMWDGDHWSSLGSGMNGAVYALLVDDDGTLYAGGNFSTAGGVATPFIAKWNGDRWSGLGMGMNHFVQSLEFDKDGMLYAGGAFTRADSVDASCIARWDGERWHPLGSGADHNVFAMVASSDGSIYAAGGFMTAGGQEANQIARWDGTQWHDVGGGLNSHTWGYPIWALALADDKLYAGGKFESFSGAPADFLAQWDGRRWSPLGRGLNGMVRALVIGSNGDLYAGGYFSRAGDVAANHVARWDGRRWHALGSGTDALVDALALDHASAIHVGGSFRLAGTRTARSLACWNVASGSALAADPPPPGLTVPTLTAAYPNPFATVATIEFSLSQPVHARLRIYDAIGRERRTLLDGHLGAGRYSVELDASGLTAGFYVYRLEAGTWMRSGIVVLQR